MMNSVRPRLAAVFALAGVLMVGPTASAQGLFHAADLQVYDGNGKKVGTLTNNGGNLEQMAEVVLGTESGHNVFLEAWPTQLLGTATVWFAEPACAGRPYLSGSTREPASAVIGPRQQLYVQVARYRNALMYSHRDGDGACHEYPDGNGGRYTPARRLAIHLGDYFTPPFALRATPGDAIPTGPVAETLEPTDRLVAFDATGKRVAAVNAYAVVTDAGVTILINGVTYWRFVYFESNDCSGPPFVRMQPYLVPAVNLLGTQEEIHVQSGASARQTMFSARTGDTCRVLRTQTGPQSFVPGVTADFAPAAPTGIELADYFTRPYTIRAGRETRPLPRP